MWPYYLAVGGWLYCLYAGWEAPTILWLVLYLPTRHPVGRCGIKVGGMVGLGGTERLKELS